MKFESGITPHENDHWMAPRFHWLILYILVNVIAVIMILNTGELLGDVAGNSLYNAQALLIALFLVVLSYALILGPLFSLLSRLKVKRFQFGLGESHSDEKIGKFLLLLSIGFLLFNLATGGNLAGKESTISNNPLRVLWVVFPVDALFVIYYGFHRDNKYFYPNLIIWFISNLLRGWAGMIVFIAFFEWCRGVRNHKISAMKTILVSVLLLVLNPFMIIFKALIRSSAVANMDFLAIREVVFNRVVEQGFFNMILESVSALISRLQVVSSLVEVIHWRTLFQSMYTDGKIIPFWLENMFGDYYYKFMENKPQLISSVIPQYFEYVQGTERDATNINIGFPGWFFIAPHLIILYLSFILILCWLSFYLIKKINLTESSKDMLWLLWLIFLLPPWLSIFVTYLYGLVLFLLLKIIFSHRWFNRLKPFSVFPARRHRV